MKSFTVEEHCEEIYEADFEITMNSYRNYQYYVLGGEYFKNKKKKEKEINIQLCMIAVEI